MLKLFLNLLILGLFYQSVSFSQTVFSVLVSGTGGQHDEDVKTSFLTGYSSYNGTEFTGTVQLFTGDVLISLQYASNNNFDLMIRSYSDLIFGIYFAPSYPDVELVMPSGSNSFIESFSGDVESSPVVITGAGIDSNVTGYQVEFFSIDPITESNFSSFANGYIAGQIAFIANTLEISFDSARVLARTNSSFNGVYDYYSGYGKIMIENILGDPLPVELTSFTTQQFEGYIELNWITQTEVNNSGFEIQRKLLLSKSDNSQWESLIFINGNGNSNSPKSYKYKDYFNGSGYRVYYRLKQIDLDGSFEYSDEVMVDLSPIKFELYQNYPNPFNPVTNVAFSLSEEGFVVLKVFSITGEEVHIIASEKMTEGLHTLRFDAGNLTSGMYIYKLDYYSNGETASSIRKMMLLR